MKKEISFPDFYISYNDYCRDGHILLEIEFSLKKSHVNEYLNKKINAKICQLNKAINKKTRISYFKTYSAVGKIEELEPIFVSIKKYLRDNNIKMSIALADEYKSTSKTQLITFEAIGEKLEQEVLLDDGYIFQIDRLFQDYIEREIFPIFAKYGIKIEQTR